MIDFSLMEHLHDAEVVSLVWDNSSPSQRRVRLSVKVDQDVEYSPWKGCSLTITMSDVVLCRLLGYGHQIGTIRIDSVSDGVTGEVENECSRLGELGIAIPPLLFTVVFGDGSTLELACGSIAVEGASHQ